MGIGEGARQVGNAFVGLQYLANLIRYLFQTLDHTQIFVAVNSPTSLTQSQRNHGEYGDLTREGLSRSDTYLRAYVDIGTRIRCSGDAAANGIADSVNKGTTILGQLYSCQSISRLTALRNGNHHIAFTNDRIPVSELKLQIPAGAANPAPPVGPALGSAGVNIMQFCKEFNAKTAKDSGLVIPVIITVYQDRSFSLQFKSPPASVLLKKEAGLAKGSGVPNKNKVGKVTKAQLLKIVEMKKADLNTDDPEQAIKMIAGTARNMGIEVVE